MARRSTTLLALSSTVSNLAITPPRLSSLYQSMAKMKLSPATAAPRLLLSKPLKTAKITSRTNHPSQRRSRKSRLSRPIQTKISQTTRSRHRSSLPSLTIKTSLTIRHRSNHRLLPNQQNRLSQRHLPSRASPTQSRIHRIHHQSQRLQLIQRLQTSSPRQQPPQIPTPRLPQRPQKQIQPTARLITLARQTSYQKLVSAN